MVYNYMQNDFAMRVGCTCMPYKAKADFLCNCAAFSVIYGHLTAHGVEKVSFLLHRGIDVVTDLYEANQCVA